MCTDQSKVHFVFVYHQWHLHVRWLFSFFVAGIVENYVLPSPIRCSVKRLYIDLARAKSEAPIKSNNKLVFHNSVNFRAHLCDFWGKDYVILEKNNLQTAQEWTKSYIELIASYVHPKTGNHLRSHLRAIMALDHRRLIMPGKKNRAKFFTFDKFTLQNLANKSGCV